MNYDEEAYNSAVNEQWEKLAKAQTKEEIQAVLDTWPEKRDKKLEEARNKLVELERKYKEAIIKYKEWQINTESND